MRFQESSTYDGSTSMPILSRPQRAAAALVVPAPMNGSRTTSPAKLNIRTNLSAKASGNGAGFDAEYVHLDVASRNDWASAVKATVERFGGPGATVRVLGAPGEFWMTSRRRYTYPLPDVQAMLDARRWRRDR